MKDRFLFWAVGVAVWLVSNAAGFAGENQSATQPSPESDAKRSAQHLRIAERRAGTVVIVHRGASAFAPENSLAAYAAAMDYGADGCEVDLRRTRDGVLVLFHDDMLDHLTCGPAAPCYLPAMQVAEAIQCPFCGQVFGLVVDSSVPSQRLVTDCEVCCRPFQLHAECEPGEILSLEVASS